MEINRKSMKIIRKINENRFKVSRDWTPSLVGGYGMGGLSSPQLYGNYTETIRKSIVRTSWFFSATSPIMYSQCARMCVCVIFPIFGRMLYIFSMIQFIVSLGFAFSFTIEIIRKSMESSEKTMKICRKSEGNQWK